MLWTAGGYFTQLAEDLRNVTEIFNSSSCIGFKHYIFRNASMFGVAVSLF